MRAALCTVALAAAALVALATGSAGAAGSARGGRAVAARAAAAPVSRGRIQAAVNRAERSASLWATINICNSPKGSGDIGIRGQMPTLGFPATLTMQIQMYYWAAHRHQFVASNSANARATLSLGRLSTDLQQDGEVFPWKGQRGLYEASVTFTWSRGGRVLGRVVRSTTGGHPDADYGSPAHYSAASCRIS